MKLSDLPDDPLFKVFSFLDVGDILSVQQTCTSFLHLTCTATVWRTVIRNIPRERTACLLPNRSPESFSASELQCLAIRATRLWKNWNWSPNGLNRASVPDDKTSLGVKVTSRVRYSLYTQDEVILSCKLTPGATHLFALTCNKLQCWDLTSITCVWEHTRNDTLYGFDFQLRKDNVLNIALAGCDDFDNYLEVLQLPLGTMVSKVVSIKKSKAQCKYYTPLIEGDYVLQNYLNYGNWVLSAVCTNWSTGHSAHFVHLNREIGCKEGEHVQFHVVLDHLVYLSKEPLPSLTCIPISELSRHGEWKTGDGIPEQPFNLPGFPSFQLPLPLPPTLSTTALSGGAEWRVVDCVVHPPTWADQKDLFRIDLSIIYTVGLDASQWEKPPAYQYQLDDDMLSTGAGHTLPTYTMSTYRLSASPDSSNPTRPIFTFDSVTHSQEGDTLHADTPVGTCRSGIKLFKSFSDEVFVARAVSQPEPTGDGYEAIPQVVPDQYAFACHLEPYCGAVAYHTPEGDVHVLHFD